MADNESNDDETKNKQNIHVIPWNKKKRNKKKRNKNRNKPIDNHYDKTIDNHYNNIYFDRRNMNRYDDRYFDRRNMNRYDDRYFDRRNMNRNKYKKKNMNNKKKDKNVIIEFSTSKNIPIQNFPFKELLENAIFQKEDKDVAKNSDNESDCESIIIDSEDEIEELDIKIESIKDLIKLGKTYDKSKKAIYPINLKKLNNLIEPLEKLDKTIGMDNIKKIIVDQIIYILQNFDKEEEMLHTVIEGPPGVGKTMLGKILGEIYYNLGIIKKKKIEKSKNISNPLFTMLEQMDTLKKPDTNKKNEDKFPFKVVRRSDLIGQYLGHTAQKTQDAIDEVNGGILFIDEAYSLGSEDMKDSYAKECIDTINQNLSENKGNFICIIAGYPEELEKYFFSQNRGLERRFVFRYKINKYSAEELFQILFSKIKKSKWDIHTDFKEYKKELIEIIQKNLKQFNNFGGDIETFFLKCKISHSNRIFGKHPKLRKKLTLNDFKEGIKLFLNNKKHLVENKSLNMMYT